ncbi:MAG: GNAT family acetyltransferase [Phyllobacterium sp.]|uniref:GNAT family acetyltransferase n=1 Tax=Phyllobacterium sp. TaxID=1871046 RepID=UPI0030F1B2F4
MIFDRITRIAFGVASAFLMLLAFGLIAYAGYEVVRSFVIYDRDIGATLLEAVGYTVIAIAVFDVGKYLLEEEAIRAREMRQAAEARRSLTKFISTIAIAVFLEGLVAVFEAGKEDLRMMIYPTLLLFTGVTLVIGLGIYQRLSAMVEKETNDPEVSRKPARAAPARRTA